MYEQYIGLNHEYGKTDCISLIQEFYKKQLNIDFNLPQYTKSKKWMYSLTASQIDEWALKYAIKTTLTKAQNYDLIVFKSAKQNIINHFGMFLLPTSMLHIEENSTSKIEMLSDYWVNSIYTIYRHEQLV
jgi:cell wall-associated NlpC family hydrolase